eukprot:CAMPEP_0206474122 /NCGR_PEP_ID=MMETSP0324_2-20121206/33286_1 /ASSEMBLY_ACC=CAM_ASM_000836 /TAXON_ID=2866 /ORGANISM="Crypthecodinium cohnii, Strain Seligo" /LENGTH=91 /DNA_ID=CAMNT_0053949209 /DNA_START=164 /DNA_END=437 /DNA_ORIENTATION=-
MMVLVMMMVAVMVVVVAVAGAAGAGAFAAAGVRLRVAGRVLIQLGGPQQIAGMPVEEADVQLEPEQEVDREGAVVWLEEAAPISSALRLEA